LEGRPIYRGATFPFITKHTGYAVPVIFCIFSAILFLSIEGVSLSGLFLSRYPAVDECFGHGFGNIEIDWAKMKAGSLDLA
jgi:hypothetical protein